MHLDADKEMMSQCVVLLGKFISVREPNIRYLGLVSVEILNSHLMNYEASVCQLLFSAI